MSTRSNDWDRDEREALEGLEDQLDAMRRRHQNDPPLELLRAARGDALPRELQETVDQHLTASPWSQALVDGAEPPEDVLEPSVESRVLAGIKRRAIRDRQTAPRRWLLPAFVGSTLAAGVLVVWVAQRQVPTTPSAPQPETTVADARPPSAPRFQLPLEKPDVKLSMAALTWRGSTTENQLLADLKPALDAYRAGDYRTADREFTTLDSRYPRTIEVLFYQGVARLMLDDPRGAIAALTAAEQVADQTFAPDVGWYRAIADERAGNLRESRARLDSLCKNGQQHASQACEALKRLDSANPQ